MAVSSSQVAEPGRRDVASGARCLGPWSLLGAVLALAYLPHMVVYAGRVMEVEHYQFLPLAWLGALVLLWARRESLRPRADVAVPALGWAGVGVAVLILTAAGVFGSPGLGVISLIPMALGLAWLLGGWGAFKAVIPSLLLFATTIRPPGDTRLIAGLRTLAVQYSSRILDAVGVIHVPSGNVILVPGSSLLIDEACSGINSLVSVLAVILFLGLLVRRHPVHLGLLMAGAVGIVILVNTLRVSLVTVAHTRWEIDLLTGWKHDALGLALYVISLALAASLDQLLLLLGSAVPRRAARPDRAGAYYGYGYGTRERAASRPAAGTGEERASPPTAGAVPPRLDRVRGRWIGPALAGFVVIQLSAWAYGSLAPGAGKAETSHLVTHAQRVITEESLPPELAGWERVGFATEDRTPDNPFSKHSNLWTFLRGGRRVIVSLDYTYRGWHELTECYRKVDWDIRDRAYEQGATGPGPGEAGPYVTAALARADGQHARLMFGLVDDQGDWIEQPLRPILQGRPMPWENSSRRPAYQIQALCTSFAPLGDEERQHVAEVFEAARQELREQLFASGAIRP